MRLRLRINDDLLIRSSREMKKERFASAILYRVLKHIHPADQVVKFLDLQAHLSRIDMCPLCF